MHLCCLLLFIVFLEACLSAPVLFVCFFVVVQGTAAVWCGEVPHACLPPPLGVTLVQSSPNSQALRLTPLPLSGSHAAMSTLAVEMAQSECTMLLTCDWHACSMPLISLYHMLFFLYHVPCIVHMGALRGHQAPDILIHHMPSLS